MTYLTVVVSAAPLPAEATLEAGSESPISMVALGGGMRMADVSGELMGTLTTQRREIGVFKPFDPDRWTANVSVVWGAQTHKGKVFFTDLASGLWSVKLLPKQRPIS